MTTAPRQLRMLLARHGETEWNRIGRWQGATDVPLNDVGREQARALGARLAGEGITAVASSDLSRAVETGQLIAEVLGVAYVGGDLRLRERSYGAVEGLTRAECQERFPVLWASHAPGSFLDAPGAEPRATVIRRMTEGLAELTDEHSPRGTLLVISHGGSIRMFLGSIREPIVPPMHNGETYEVLRATGTFHTFRKLHDDRRG